MDEAPRKPLDLLGQPEQPIAGDEQSRLLADLADRRLARQLARLGATARQEPEIPLRDLADKQHAPALAEDDRAPADATLGGERLGHGGPLPVAVGTGYGTGSNRCRRPAVADLPGSRPIAALFSAGEPATEPRRRVQYRPAARSVVQGSGRGLLLGRRTAAGARSVTSTTSSRTARPPAPRRQQGRGPRGGVGPAPGPDAVPPRRSGRRGPPGADPPRRGARLPARPRLRVVRPMARLTRPANRRHADVPRAAYISRAASITSAAMAVRPTMRAAHSSRLAQGGSNRRPLGSRQKLR